MKTFLFLLPLLIALAPIVPLAAADSEHSPETEQASLQLTEGFQVNLFASERDGVVKPIQCRFDSRGRLWVIGSTVYPQIEPGQKPNDKLWILEDSDNDGRADKTTVFADDLMIPTGLELADGGAYVGHGTELLFLKDTNGDGKADQRRVVLRGFGTGDNHQNINSFRWGPGGELWMSQGLHTHSRVETPWGIVRVEQAGLWRFRPRVTRLEGFYGSQHEPQNPWGFVFTRWGEPIVLAGNNSSPIYPVPGMVPTFRPQAPTLIWRNGSGRKVSGGEIVETRHFPEAWQGKLIMGGYINNAVWAVKVLDDGAGFVLEDFQPLIKTTNRNFRPVDVRFGPDGALYLCDWYNPIIGHYQASFRHPDRDKSHGRIWRVTASGRPLTPSPRLERMTSPELLDQLKSPDGWTRHFAKRVLADRKTPEVVKALSKWMDQGGLSEHELVEALGVLQSHESHSEELVARLSRAKDPGARAYSAAVAGAWAGSLKTPLALLQPLAEDSHPRVRLQALIAGAQVPTLESLRMALKVADHPRDKFIDYALIQVVHSLKSQWLPALNSGDLSDPGILQKLVQLDRSTDVLSTIRRQLGKGAGKGEALLWEVLADHAETADLDAAIALNDRSLLKKLLPRLSSTVRRKSLVLTEPAITRLAVLAGQTDQEVRAEALRLLGAARVRSQIELLLKFAASEQEPEFVRGAAIEGLGWLGDKQSIPLLESLLQQSPATLQLTALQALIQLDLERSARLAAAMLQSASPETAGQVFVLILQRPKGGGLLASYLQNITPPVAAAGMEMMNKSGRRDEKLAGRLQELAKTGQPQAFKLPPEAWTQFTSEVKDHGNALQGQAIYQRPTLGCVACHLVNGAGGKVGPDLSALGTAQPVDFIIGAILQPQKEIKEGFEATGVVTRDGEEYQGYLVRESAEELVLRDVLQNQEVRLRRQNIQERKAIGSLMPESLVEGLSREEFRDLVKYLSLLGKVK